jgi:MORN repeat variant
MRNVFRVVGFVLLAGCATETPDSEKNHMVTIHRTDGKVYSEVSYKGEKPHGPSRLYHPDGKLFLEIMYKDGVKHGTSKQYYQRTGTLYLEAQYVDGIMQGIAKKYHKDGKLKAEMPFRDDFECLGLKEYILNGDPRPHYPEIIITPENRLLTDNQYVLHVSLSERVQSADFFMGELKNDCLHDALQSVTADGNDKGLIIMNVVPGESLRATLNIIARIETIAGNVLVTQQSHRVEINFSY